MHFQFPVLLAASLLLGSSMMAGNLRAQEEATKNAPLNTLDPTPRIRRAIAAMQAGEWKTAQTAWEEVLLLDPENAAALSNLGKVQFQLAAHPEARISLEKATALDPSLTDSWLTLGLVYMELKAPMMAVSATTRGVAENPSDPRAHNSLAIILKRIGWTTGAEAELQKALDLDPEFAEAHFNLAVLLLERKPPSLEMAARHYRKARGLGAAPDEVVEKQIRGESTLMEPGENPEDAPGETGASDGDTPQTSLPSPPRAVPVADEKSPPAAPARKNPTPPRKKNSPS